MTESGSLLDVKMARFTHRLHLSYEAEKSMMIPKLFTTFKKNLDKLVCFVKSSSKFLFDCVSCSEIRSKVIS